MGTPGLNQSETGPAAPAGHGAGETLAPDTIVADRYRIIEFLAEGGMGAVYRAEHRRMHKVFALKVLHGSLLQNPEVVARFEREAVAAGNIDHPNVAGATDFGRLPDGSFFLVLEYVRGRSLRDVIDAGALEPARAVAIMRGIVAGVGAAHAKGIVHRDLKPENVMLVDQGGDPDFVKVLDFGIAKVDPCAPGGSERGVAPLTAIGSVIGTPEYMAPEQVLGEAVDARSDLYSLGVIFYELLSGERPFVGSAVSVLQRHVLEEPPAFSAELVSRLDPRVAGIVRKLLAKGADDRFDSASSLAAALDDVAGPERRVVIGPAPSPTSGPTSARRTVAAGRWFMGKVTKISPRARVALAVSMALVAWVVVRALTSGSQPAAIAPQAFPSASNVEGPPAAETSPPTTARAMDSAPLALPPPPEAQGSAGGTPEAKSTGGPAQTSPPSRGSAHRRTGPGGIYIPPPRDWFK